MLQGLGLRHAGEVRSPVLAQHPGELGAVAAVPVSRTRPGGDAADGAETAVVRRLPDGGPADPGAVGGPADRPGADWRRWLQLGLAALWMFDAVLQLQAAMFRSGLARMVSAAAQPNPSPVAAPELWTAHLVGQHPAAFNTVFAAIQVALALGIAWRPVVRPALAASIVWAIAVWWLGEGLGGVLTPAANPVTGAPGAAVLYAMLAVVVWPARRERPGRSAAARAVGAPAAAALWLALWGGLAWLAVSASRSPRLLAAQVAALADGQPPWLRAVDVRVAPGLARWGTPVCLVLALLYLVIAVGGAGPVRSAAIRSAAARRRAHPAGSAGQSADRPGRDRAGALTRSALGLAIVLALAAWAVGQDFGGAFAAMSTDPNSGPLLALLALAYWPATSAAADSPAERSVP